MKPLDHALAIVKAALSLDPYGVGGSIASLISDYVPNSRQKALEKAVELLIQKVADIESRIDAEAINKEDFADLFGKFTALAAKTNREVKLRAAANILANALLPPSDSNRSHYGELEHLMHCADTLSSGAIALLGASIQVAGQIREPRPINRSAALFHFSEIRQKLPDLDPQLVLGFAAELRSLNLLHITEGAIPGPDLQHYSFRVTPLGFRFAERFIEGRM